MDNFFEKREIYKVINLNNGGMYFLKDTPNDILERMLSFLIVIGQTRRNYFYILLEEKLYRNEQEIYVSG